MDRLLAHSVLDLLYQSLFLFPFKYQQTICRNKLVYLKAKARPVKRLYSRPKNSLSCDNSNPIPQEADRLKIEAEYFQMEELQQQLEYTNQSHFLSQGTVNMCFRAFSYLHGVGLDLY